MAEAPKTLENDPEPSELVEKAKRWFKFAIEAETKQREREREDLRFQVPELQWDEDARAARAGGIVGVQVTPARPMLSISLLTQPMQLIRNQAQNAKLGVEIHPVSEDADEELAEVKQGLYRRIERDSNANVARLWALDRAVQSGRGWYRVNTQWDEHADNPFDQEIVIERIYDQTAVYMDPGANREDFSDARWCMVVAWVPVETFKEEFPDAQVPANDQAFAAWAEEDPDWVRLEGDHKAVRVAEIFYKEFKRSEEEVGGRKRTKEEVLVKYCKVTSRDVLEESDWNGRYIPVIPVLGRELQPFDGERRWEGMVRQSRDGQRMFNYAASTLVERMALEPKAPFIGAEGQFEGHEQEWMQANVRNMPFLEYKPTSLGGNLAPPPQRSQIDGAGMSLALQALQQAKGFIQASTSVYAPSLGDMPEEQTAQSGRAILALQQQSDAGTGHFLQTLASVSMMYEAKVILDLMPTIYDRPGRITQILNVEDEPKMVMLNRPFTPGPNGRPVAAPPGATPRPPGPKPPQMPPGGPMGAPMGGPPGMPPQGMPPQQPQPEPPEVKEYDLSKGQYSISVSVGKSFQTRLQEGQAEIGGVLEKAPQLMAVIGDLYFKFRDFPGHKEIAERLAKIREQQFPGLTDDEENAPSVTQLQQQIQQMGQQVQQMGQQLMQAQKALETDQAKQQATMAKAQMDNQTKMLIAKLDALTDIQKTMIQVKAKHEEGELERDHEAEADQFEADHETAMAVITKPEPAPAGSKELEERD